VEGDQDGILMIGGISMFLPCAQVEAESCIADDTTTAGEQLAMTVRKEEELEQTLGASQADLEKSEHPEEELNAFSDEAEETATWEFVAGAEAENEHS
jgi:hypothetical protein